MNEIKPPWIEYAGYPPGDVFWRQSGQVWFVYVWEPFWSTLAHQERQDYFTRFNAPEEWRLFYSSEFHDWLIGFDEE